MVAAFPLAKLGVLLVKQVSKPIAAAAARHAKKSPFFRNYICIPIAQGFHLFDVKVRMRILNLGKVTKVPKLNEEKAIEEGAQLLSEIVILSIAAGLVTYEYRRSSEKEDAKQEAMEKEKFELYQRIVTLELAMDRQASEITQLQRQKEKPKWFPSLGSKKQDETASSETEKVMEKSPQVTNAAKVVANDQFDQTREKSAMSSQKINDPDSGCSLGGMDEGVIMGAVSDFLDEKRVISASPRSSRSVPWPGEETKYKQGAVLEAVDDFLDTLDECRDD